MYLFDLLIEIIIKILEFMDDNENFSIKDILNFATCQKNLMNALINLNQKFYKIIDKDVQEIIKIKCPFFSYCNIKDINMSNSKKIYYDCSNDSLFSKIPNNVKDILFCNKFNSCIDKLPNNINYLQLGQNFNTVIKKLPYNIRKLKVSTVYYTSNICKQNFEYYDNFLEILKNTKYSIKIIIEKYTFSHVNLNFNHPVREIIFALRFNLPIRE